MTTRERILALLRPLASPEGGRTVKQLSEAVGVSIWTVHRHLKAMEDEGSVCSTCWELGTSGRALIWWRQ